MVSSGDGAGGTGEGCKELRGGVAGKGFLSYLCGGPHCVGHRVGFGVCWMSGLMTERVEREQG